MNTLITFIGRGSYVINSDCYQESTYTFPDGCEVEKCTYLGTTLFEKFAPEKFVVIGTSTSHWYYLIDYFSNVLEENEELANRIISEKIITTEILSELENSLNKLYPETNFVLRIVSDLEKEDDQQSIFSSLVGCISKGDTVSIDITHGFRYMPIFSIMSLQFLSLSQQVEVKDIYYTTYNNSTHSGRVLKLNYIYEMYKWSQSFNLYDKTGNLEFLNERLKATSGISSKQIDDFSKFSYYENLLKIKASSSYYGLVKSFTSDDPVYKSIKNEILERVSWSTKTRVYARFAYLACKYLEQKSYVLAVICAFETIRKKYIFDYENANSDSVKYEDMTREDRELLDGDFKIDKGIYSANSDLEKKAFPLLKQLRNMLAHGEMDETATSDASYTQKILKDKIDKAIKNEEEFQKLINSCFKDLHIFEMANEK